MSVTRHITVRWSVPGMHCWPDATPERGYLADHHRHLFHVHVVIPVDHEDREVEFHDLLEYAQEALTTFPLVGGAHDFGHRSCEALALLVAAYVQAQWPRPVRVAVLEDGECGAVVEVD